MLLRTLLSVFIPGLLSILLSIALNTYSPLISMDWVYGLLFLAALSLILNIVYAYYAGAENFTQLLIVAIVLKLLLALIVVLVYSFMDRTAFFNFSIHFILHYILFTLFEISYVLYLIKKTQIHV